MKPSLVIEFAPAMDPIDRELLLRVPVAKAPRPRGLRK
jgi:hypothetical protein